MNREGLGFAESVLLCFAFLADFDLRLVEKVVTFVRYESERVFLNVFHGRTSYELGIEVGRLDEPKQVLTLYDLVGAAGAMNSEGFGKHVMFQVSSREGVQEFVPKLASLVQAYGTPFLRGDADAYAKVLKTKAHAASECARNVHLRQVREKAESAWHEKDIARVVELYGAIRKDLTEVEARRFSYAERRQSKNSSWFFRLFSRRSD
jgi:hypothetical protein